MIARRALVALAIVAGIVAGAIYQASLQRVTVVVAAHELAADRAIGPADVALRELPPDAVPDGAARSADAVVGRVPRAPQWPGQVLVAPALASGAASFASGLLPPAGQRAVAIPVTPGQAVGGALVAGAHVDVVAIPLSGRAPAGRTTELIATNVTVLDVRGENGGPLGHEAGRPGAIATDRLGSVVVAIPAVDELRIADRIATSTFVLVFVPVRE